MSDLEITFSSAQKIRMLNCLSTLNGVKGTLNGKDYSAAYKVFTFLAAFRYRATGHFHKPKHAIVHIFYLWLTNESVFKTCGVIGLKMNSYN